MKQTRSRTHCRLNPRNASQQMESLATAARVVKQAIHMLALLVLEVGRVGKAVKKVFARQAMRAALKIIGMY